MKREHLEKLPVDENDFTAVEAWLEQMAGKGYYLNETAWSWWYFKERAPGRVRYRLDAVTEADGKPDPQKLEDYGAAGWRYVTTHAAHYHIFEAEDQGAEELHTDPIVKSFCLADYEKRMKNASAMSMAAVISHLILVGGAVRRNIGYPARLVVSPEFPVYIFCSIFVLFLLIRRYKSLRRFREMRRELELGKNVLPDPSFPGKKRYERLISYTGAVILLFFVISLFHSCGTGGPVEQQLRYGDIFPALEFLEAGTVEPVDDDGSGSVIYYSSPFLRERYEVEEKGRIRKNGEADAAETGVPSELEAEFFDVRFRALALRLNEELKKEFKADNPNVSFKAVPQDGFDEYLIADLDGAQVLHARIGCKILRIRYKGGEALSGKADVLREIMNGRRPE